MERSKTHSSLSYSPLPPPATIEQGEKYTAFGRGAVRAARIKTVLEDPSWNWCGLATFYSTVALLGIVVVVVLNETGAVGDTKEGFKHLQWAVATLLLPGGLSLLYILVHLCNEGVIEGLRFISVHDSWYLATTAPGSSTCSTPDHPSSVRIPQTHVHILLCLQRASACCTAPLPLPD